MDVRPIQLPQTAPPSAARRALEAALADGAASIRQGRTAPARPSEARPPEARPPETQPPEARLLAAPTSTQELAALLSEREQEALRTRFADLPREGITRPAGYNPRGRTANLPPAQGRLLDITG